MHEYLISFELKPKSKSDSTFTPELLEEIFGSLEEIFSSVGFASVGMPQGHNKTIDLIYKSKLEFEIIESNIEKYLLGNSSMDFSYFFFTETSKRYKSYPQEKI